MTRTGLTANEKHWNKVATSALKGRRIIDARYMTEDEAQAVGWHCRPVIIVLDNGTLWYSSQDNEGNDGGALLFSTDTEDGRLPAL